MGLCLTLVTLAQPDPDRRVAFRALPCTCLITVNLPDHLNLQLNIPGPALLALLGYCGMDGAWAGEAPVLLAAFLLLAPCSLVSGWLLLLPGLCSINLGKKELPVETV